MTQRPWHVRRRWRAPALLALAATAVAPVLAATSASAPPRGSRRRLAARRPADQRVGVHRQREPAHPGSDRAAARLHQWCVTATADGSYPGVFNNVLADGSFGITSPIFLNEVTPAGSWSARCGYRTGRGLVSRAAPAW